MDQFNPFFIDETEDSSLSSEDIKFFDTIPLQKRYIFNPKNLIYLDIGFLLLTSFYFSFFLYNLPLLSSYSSNIIITLLISNITKLSLHTIYYLTRIPYAKLTSILHSLKGEKAEEYANREKISKYIHQKYKYLNKLLNISYPLIRIVNIGNYIYMLYYFFVLRNDMITYEFYIHLILDTVFYIFLLPIFLPLFIYSLDLFLNRYLKWTLGDIVRHYQFTGKMPFTFSSMIQYLKNKDR